ncbi:helix-turn-helix transcriptional regulator [Oscillospiraceae bacterium 42-9]
MISFSISGKESSSRAAKSMYVLSIIALLMRFSLLYPHRVKISNVRTLYIRILWIYAIIIYLLRGYNSLDKISGTGENDMELNYRAIGKRIKIERIKADLTQEKLAEMAGLSPTHMSNVETGSTRVSLTLMVSIANALGVTLDDLMCDSVTHARVQFEQDIADILSDCDTYEIRMIADMAQALKDTLRRDAHLRNQ